MSRRHPTWAECVKFGNLDAFERGGFAQVVSPASDAGQVSYGAGRLLLPARTNYATNPGLEVFTGSIAAGWATNPLAGETTKGPAAAIGSGAFCQHIAYTGVSGDNNAALGFYTGSAIGGFSAADPVTVSVLLAGALSGCALRLKVFDQAWTEIHTEAVALTSTPTRFSSSGVCPAGTSGINISVETYGISAGATLDLYIDDVFPEKAASASPYFDGNSGGGCAWTGAENESTSTRPEGTIVYTDLVTITNAGASAAGTNVAYARNASGTYHGPVLVTPTAKSAGDQTAIAALWHDPASLFGSGLVAIGDTLIPLNGDSRGFRKVK